MLGQDSIRTNRIEAQFREDGLNALFRENRIRKFLISNVTSNWFTKAYRSDSVVQAEEHGTKIPFEQQAPEAAARSVFQTIVRWYKTQDIPPSDLVADNEHPVKISFSETNSGEVTISAIDNSVDVKGKISLYVAESIVLSVGDAGAEGLAKGSGMAVEMLAPKSRIKSGKYRCEGTFTVKGKTVMLRSGEAQIAGGDKPVKFSEEAQALIDGKEFSYKDGTWQPRISGAPKK